MAHLSNSSLVADAVQRVDEDAGCCCRGEGQIVLNDEALAQRQVDEDSNQGDAQQVGNDTPQLWVVYILQAASESACCLCRMPRCRQEQDNGAVTGDRGLQLPQEWHKGPSEPLSLPCSVVSQLPRNLCSTDSDAYVRTSEKVRVRRTQELLPATLPTFS